MSITLGIDARLANAAHRAGVGRFCFELVAALSKRPEPPRLRLYLDGPPSPELEQFKGPAVEFRSLPPRRFWTHRALGAELRKNPPDAFFSPVMQLPLACPVPSVVSVHDLAFLEHGEHFTPRQRIIARLQARQVARNATRLLCISEATRDHVVQALKVPPHRIVVSLAGSSDRFRPIDDPRILEGLRQRLNLPARFVLYVGRLQPRKNIARLIEAYARVRQAHPELMHDLVIAGGKGWMWEGILQTAQQSPCARHIHFIDYVNDEDLPALINAADLLALVSLWEGFGLPVLEALACGTAVLTSNCSSLPEVAGDAAFLVDPYNPDEITRALERLLTDDAYRRSFAARGPARAAQFTWDYAAGRLLEAAVQAIKSKRAR